MTFDCSTDFPAAAGLAPANIDGKSDQPDNDARQTHPEVMLHDAFAPPPSHGLLSRSCHAVIDGAASVFGASDGSAQSSLAWDASDTMASFAKSVPLFLGPGKGRLMAAALGGVDAINPAESLANQTVDVALGATKGLLNKELIDRFGAGEMSLAAKGAIIGGGSSLVDSVLSRRTWLNQNGDIDGVLGVSNIATQTTLGSAIGIAAFPLGSFLGSRLSPVAQTWLGKQLDSRFVSSLATGGAFGATGGLVSETMKELTAGEGLSPLTIAKRSLLEGASTMAAAGTGYGIGGGRAFLSQSPLIEHQANSPASDGLPPQPLDFTGSPKDCAVPQPVPREPSTFEQYISQLLTGKTSSAIVRRNIRERPIDPNRDETYFPSYDHHPSCTHQTTLIPMLKDVNGGRTVDVLELGSGSTTSVPLSLGDRLKSYISLDVIDTFVSKQRSNLDKVHFDRPALQVQGDQALLPLPAESRDLVVAFHNNVMFYPRGQTEAQQAFNEVARVLRPGGSYVTGPFFADHFHYPLLKECAARSGLTLAQEREFNNPNGPNRIFVFRKNE